MIIIGFVQVAFLLLFFLLIPFVYDDSTPFLEYFKNFMAGSFDLVKPYVLVAFIILGVLFIAIHKNQKFKNK